MIWSAYQWDTNACGFWLVKWILWWKKFLSKNFLVSIDTSLWHHTATRLANQTMLLFIPYWWWSQPRSGSEHHQYDLLPYVWDFLKEALKVFSQEVAVLAPFDLWIFLRGIPFFLKGERKNGLFLVGRENCVSTFGLFLLGGKSQPTSSMKRGGLLLNGMAQTWGLIKFTKN